MTLANSTKELILEVFPTVNSSMNTAKQRVHFVLFFKADTPTNMCYGQLNFSKISNLFLTILWMPILMTIALKTILRTWLLVTI